MTRDTRPAAELAHTELRDLTNGVRVVLVEDPSRFARSVIAQELGAILMAQRGGHLGGSSCPRRWAPGAIWSG